MPFRFMVKWKKYRREMKKSAEWPWLMMLSAVDARKRDVDEQILNDCLASEASSLVPNNLLP